MEDLKQQFKKETDLSFDDIPINGIHLEYINWLEKRIEALSISNVVGQSEQLMQSCSVCGTTKHPVLGAHCKASNCPHEH